MNCIMNLMEYGRVRRNNICYSLVLFPEYLIERKNFLLLILKTIIFKQNYFN